MTQPALPLDQSDDQYGISIRVENKEIFAAFTTASGESLELSTLRQIINDSGYSSAYIDDALMESVVSAYNQKRENIHLKVGECRDAYCKIIISPDKQKAFLSTNIAQGGRQLSRATIFKAIVKAGVRRGIINQCITYALQQGRVDRILIARGARPINGKDSQFKPLITKYRDRRPYIDDDGRAHYQDIGNLITVSAGEALMRRLPSTKGVAGFDVLGNELAARDGEFIPFSNDLTGVTVDSNDPNLLIASVNGQPLMLNHGAIVEKTISIEDVDLNCGNIDFDGSIAISGNVSTGMTVVASGDVVIDGMVEAAATIRAGGNIVVQQGIIGRGATADENGETGKGTAIIEAGGKICARFIEHAKVTAGQSILIDELLAHSDVESGDVVVVGNKKSKNGHIRGGKVVASNGISAEVLGSPAGVATQLICGNIETYREKLLQTQQNMEECRQRRRLLEQNLARQCVAASANKNKHAGKNVIQRTQTQLDEVNNEINLLHQETTQLKQHIEECCNSKIQCLKKAYPNIDIYIADANLKLSEEKSMGHFFFQDRQILFTSIQ